MALRINKNEATTAKRRQYYHLVDATDGITPETGEAGGQPQRSYDGAAWVNTSGVLVHIGNGRYYVELTQAEVDQAHLTVIEGRYKTANTAEAPGTIIQIFDPTVDIASLSTFDDTVDPVIVGTLQAGPIQAIWDALTSALTTAGSIGKLLVDNIDAAISSRATPADILNAAAEGVIQSNFPVTDGGTQRIPRGDVATITLNAGTSWDLSGGERVFFAMKLDKFDELGNVSAKVNREATIVQTNPLIATFTFTSDESDTAGSYDAEFEQRDADGVSNPLTITKDFKVIVFEDVRK